MTKAKYRTWEGEQYLVEYIYENGQEETVIKPTLKGAKRDAKDAMEIDTTITGCRIMKFLGVVE